MKKLVIIVVTVFVSFESYALTNEDIQLQIQANDVLCRYMMVTGSSQSCASLNGLNAKLMEIVKVNDAASKINENKK